MNEGKRFASKLLFQWRIEIDGLSNKMRTCEEQILTAYKPSRRAAFCHFVKRGKEQQFKEFNEDYSKSHNCECYVYYEFIGIMEIMELGIETEEDEVWYSIKKYLEPMERKRSLTLIS